MANLYSMEGHFTSQLHFYIVKCGKNNFVNIETKLQKLCKAFSETDFTSKYPIKKLLFWNSLDGILCLLGEFHVKKTPRRCR